MPDRDYYLDPSPRMAEIRTKYQAHIAARARSSPGSPTRRAKAARIFELEKKIARGAREPRGLRGRRARATTTGRARTSRQARPGLDWDGVLRGRRARRAARRSSSGSRRAVTGIAALVRVRAARRPGRTTSTFHAIERAATFLPEGVRRRALRVLRQDAHGHAEAARPLEARRRASPTPRSARRSASSTSRSYFPAVREGARRGDGEERDRGVRDAASTALDWMAPADEGARRRRSSPRSRSASAIPTSGATTRASRSSRATRSATRSARRSSSTGATSTKLGQPVDRGEWVMNPQLVNAVNLPAMNALNFPAAILQPPYFDPQRARGHGLRRDRRRRSATRSATASTTRARCSTPTGRLQNWWTKEDFAHFKASAAAARPRSTTPTGRSPTSPSTAS